MAEANVVPSHQEYLGVIFRRCVLALLGARLPEDCVLQREAVEYMVMLAEQHMQHLFEHLNILCRTQRRTKPSMEDIALMLFFEEMNVLDLEQEKAQTPELEESTSVSALNNLVFDLELAPIGSAEAVFFETPTSLVPSSRDRPPYMPSWMPPLPPEHTYMHTENYSSEIKDLRQVRQRLVEEGRLAEVALQRLIGDRGSASIIELPRSGQRLSTTKNMVVVDQEAESPQSSAPTSKPRGLSLRISLGKTKKRKENVLGKRPRVDLVDLARRNAKEQNGDGAPGGAGSASSSYEGNSQKTRRSRSVSFDHSNEDREDSYYGDETKDREDAFSAALESLRAE